MDLIRDNYQSSDDEEIEVIVIDDDPEPVPIPFEQLTPREKQEVFKQELVAFPEIKLDKYRCNWCPELMSRQSVQRHVRTVHPDRYGGDWRDHCHLSTISLFSPYSIFLSIFLFRFWINEIIALLLSFFLFWLIKSRLVKRILALLWDERKLYRQTRTLKIAWKWTQSNKIYHNSALMFFPS